jgi:GT2 family glycosyltransferase
MRQPLFTAIAKGITLLYKQFQQVARYLITGIQQGAGGASLWRCAGAFLAQMNQFVGNLYEESVELAQLESPSMKKWQATAKGLHSLLPDNPHYTFSILMPVVGTVRQDHLKLAIQSALDQSAEKKELLLCSVNQPQDVILLLETFAKEHSNVKHIEVNLQNSEEQESSLYQLLGQHASGHYLLLFSCTDWMRPDLLLRYEQTLRFQKAPENCVLYCHTYQINNKNYPIPKLLERTPNQVYSPYLFLHQIEHGILVPKALWDKVGGFSTNVHTMRYYDLFLKLCAINAHFICVPFYLYAYRKALSSSESEGVAALKRFAENKQLDWEIEKGYIQNTFRAIPKLHKTPTIHAIVPFKEQKELTLKAVKSFLQQKGVTMKVTAIDNGSQDHSIAPELTALGVEVLTVREPFNYSRLNNLAIQKSKIGEETDALLIVNNDVELELDAVEEMSRWLEQPHIGIVGCRLHYPNGLLQHGGVRLCPNTPIWRMTWEHTEKLQPFKRLRATLQLGVVKAVTAACVLIKRKTFVQVGGFDEIWYPIAYSDTNLCLRLEALGLYCFYTPYAVGIHHESISRATHCKEDYENSYWLHNQLTCTHKV